MPITVVSIPGLHCEGCAMLVKDVSSEYPQIAGVNVDLTAKTVALEHAADFDLPAWKQEIESLGDAYKIFPA